MAREATAGKRDREAARRVGASHLTVAQRIAPHGSWELDVGRNVLTWSEEAFELFGIAPEDFDGTYAGWLTLVHPDDRPSLDRSVYAALSGREACEVRYRVPLPTGAVRVVHARSESACDTEGKPVRLFGTVRDVTSATAAERELRKLSEAVEQSSAAIVITDRDGRIEYVNRAFTANTGYASAEVLGKNPRILQSGVTPRAVYEDLWATILAGRTWEGEICNRRKNGETYWERAVISPVVDAAGHITHFIASKLDVTAQRAARQALKEAKDQYRMLFDHNPYPVAVIDGDTLAFLDVNEALVQHYGYSREELLRMTVHDVRVPEDAARCGEDYASAAAERAEDRLKGTRRNRRKDGQVIDVEVVRKPITFEGRPAWLVHVTDVTEKRALEAQLLQAQRIESMGRLAGGVAHDFNNLLGVVTGYSEMLRRRVGDDPRLLRYLDQITKAADRGASLTHQLLAFSRKQVLQPRTVDLNEIVADTEAMLRRLIGEDIELVTRLGEDLGAVRADPGQMVQVIVNLAVNARDAMPRGGRLTIATSNVRLAPAEDGRQAGDYVAVSVRDTGEGMPPEVRARIFEPFFTTKQPGQGTGLGLATVHGIVTQSGGHVTVDSAPGLGTTFTIHLPRLAGPAPREQKLPPVAPPRGSETVLLVEDEAPLREIVRETLRELGYDVVSASNGEEALALAAGRDRIDLVLTDVVMPGMSGRELAEAIRSRRPGARVLYMSGYTDDAVVVRGISGEEAAFIQKPFTPHLLAGRVREALDRPAS